MTGISTSCFTGNASDWIFVHDLAIRTTLGSSLWDRPGASSRSQPVNISIAVPHSVRLAGSSDHLAHSVNYGSLAKTIERRTNSGNFSCMEEMAQALADAVFADFPVIEEIRVTVTKPRALLNGRSATIQIVRSRTGTQLPTSDGVTGTDQILINDLELSTIIGVNPWERVSKQMVRINLVLDVEPWSSTYKAFDYEGVASRVSAVSVVLGRLPLTNGS